MVRRRKKSEIEKLFEMKVWAAPLAGLWVFGYFISNATLGSMLLLIGILGIALFFFIKIKAFLTDRLETKLDEMLSRHENALVSYFQQSVSEDLFGNLDDKKWQAHIDTFLRTQFASGKSNFGDWRNSREGQQMASRVDRFTRSKLEILQHSEPLARVDTKSLTPAEYERHCGEILHRQGWKIQMTPATRDGGADFIAEKGEYRLIAQCKRYAKPVGNKAVQEVHSAVKLYAGNAACVIAPTGFTAQAQREAHSLSIALLHHSSLQAFAEKLEASGI